MSVFTSASVFTGLIQAAGHDYPFDDKGYTTENAILPPVWEMIIGSAASIIVFAVLYKFGGPVVKKAMADRTAGIQAKIDDSAKAKADAENEAARIRQAKGNIDEERARLYAEADTQAEALLAEGRIRLDAEIAELEQRADADVNAAAGRSTDELRSEIARHAGTAVDRIVGASLDDAAQQELIENFIARVGASTGASA